MTGTRADHLRRFYAILGGLEERLGAKRTLAQCTGRMGWPARGVYFFLEDGEVRSDTGDGGRMVRVGTHALSAGSGTKLWTRLSQHRGSPRTGSGNHRGSIFRLIVGAALSKRHGYDYPTWGRGSAAPAAIRSGEVPLEQEVSRTIGAMPFLWLAADDESGPGSMRGYIERNAIALLSNFDRAPIDPPSPGWLGHQSDRDRVRRSGIWNSNHVHETYDPAFLDQLERLLAGVEVAR